MGKAKTNYQCLNRRLTLLDHAQIRVLKRAGFPQHQIQEFFRCSSTSYDRAHRNDRTKVAKGDVSGDKTLVGAQFLDLVGYGQTSSNVAKIKRYIAASIDYQVELTSTAKISGNDMDVNRKNHLNRSIVASEEDELLEDSSEVEAVRGTPAQPSTVSSEGQ